MVDIYWPASVNDDPREDTLQWSPVENGKFATTASGRVRAAPVNSGVMINMQADYDMSDHMFMGQFLLWWQADARDGGCNNGVTPFWLRDPLDRKPYRWIRSEGGVMRPVRDGVGYIVNLQLVRLAT